MNYAEALEHEAFHLARNRLTSDAERLSVPKDELASVLTQLDLIHARNMELAAEWVQPRRSSVRANPPLTEDFVTKAAVVPLSRNLEAEARAEAGEPS
jgi:hypothetical protein